MCCGCRMCMLCTCLLMVALTVGFLYLFGVFKTEYHKVKDDLHLGFLPDPPGL